MSALWTVGEAATATGGQAIGDWQVTGISIDTRTLQPGDLFVALKAARDGHDFVAQALEKGAGAALVTHRPEGVAKEAPLLIVEDVQAALEALKIHTRVISAIPMDQVCEPYIRRRAVRHLEKGRVCIFAAGTGNPYFTTDTAATLRANEMACEAIFMGKNGVDGVYDKDPKEFADAKRYDTVTYDDVLAKRLRVMDASAIALARDNNLPLIVFGLDAPGGFRGVLAGEGTYTKVQG